MQRYEKTKRPPRVFTAQAVLLGGSRIELVRDPQDGLARLLHWNARDKQIRQPRRLTVGKVPYLPIDEPEV